MALPVSVPGDLQVSGNLSVLGTFAPPAGTIDNAAVKAGATGNYILATKVAHQGVGIGGSLELVGPTTAITAITRHLFMAKGAGTLASFGVWLTTASTVDGTVTVDLKKSTGAGAFATVLSGTIGLSTATAPLTLIPGTITSAAYIAGDIFEVVTAVAIGSGNQCKGLGIQLACREEPA